MMLSARISGQRSYRGEIVAQGDWEPIITPDHSARLRALLTDPARLTVRTVRRYLLSGGLLRCRPCGAVLVARPRGDGARRYVCAKGPGKPGCGGVAILAEPLEALIAEAVLYRLDTPELGRGPRRSVDSDDNAERCGHLLSTARSSMSWPPPTANARSRSPSTSPPASPSRPGSRPSSAGSVERPGPRPSPPTSARPARSARRGGISRSPVSAQSSPRSSTGPPSALGCADSTASTPTAWSRSGRV